MTAMAAYLSSLGRALEPGWADALFAVAVLPVVVRWHLSDRYAEAVAGGSAR